MDATPVVERAFPDRTVREVGDTGPSWNPDTATVRVAFATHPPAYLKCARDGDGERIRRERAAIEFVADTTDVAVPTVLRADPDGQRPYLATEAMTGDSLLARWSGTDGETRRKLAAGVGRTLARVHEQRFDTAGRVVGGDGEGLRLDPAAWPDVLAESIRHTRAMTDATRYDDYFDRLLDALDGWRDRLTDAPAVLLHGDPARPNAVVSAGSVGLLDWERAHVGDPVRDLYRARSQQFAPTRGRADPAIVAAYHEGYAAVAGSLPDGYDQRRRVYEAVRLTGPVAFFDNYVAFDDTDETAFAGWLETEIEQRLAALTDS